MKKGINTKKNFYAKNDVAKYILYDFTVSQVICRVRNLKFATYLKFATCEYTNKINELRRELLNL